jgi:type IV pilus assembly protein PilA
MQSRKGFTLIELLIVVVIIGILAAIAIPALGRSKERAAVASMKSDLRNLVTAQEGFFAGYSDYAGDAGVAEVPGTGGAGVVAFTPSAGNTVVLSYMDLGGWAATVTSPAVTTASTDVCGIFTGDATVYAGAAGLNATDPEGVAKCY